MQVLLKTYYRKSPDHVPTSIKELNDPVYKSWIIEILEIAPRKEAEEYILASLILAIQDFTKKQNFELTNSHFDSQEFFSHAVDTIWRGCTRLTPDLVPTFNNWVLLRLNGAVQDARRKHDPLSRNDRLFYKRCQEKLEETHLAGKDADIWEIIIEFLPSSMSLAEKKIKAFTILEKLSSSALFGNSSDSSKGDAYTPIDTSFCPERNYQNNEYVDSIMKRAKRIGLSASETTMLREIITGQAHVTLPEDTKVKISTYLSS